MKPVKVIIKGKPMQVVKKRRMYQDNYRAHQPLLVIVKPLEKERHE